jgi:hypothetical protein
LHQRNRFIMLRSLQQLMRRMQDRAEYVYTE